MSNEVSVFIADDALHVCCHKHIFVLCVTNKIFVIFMALKTNRETFQFMVILLTFTHGACQFYVEHQYFITWYATQAILSTQCRILVPIMWLFAGITECQVQSKMLEMLHQMHFDCRQ